MGHSVTVRPRGMYGYSCSAGIGAASVYWSPDRDDVFVVLTGEACELLGSVGLVALASDLDLEPTSRLDLAWDTDLFTPSTIRSAWRSGDVVTRVHRTPDPNRPDRPSGLEWRESPDGDTAALGSRSSQRYVRVYDRRGPTRMELELKEDRAVLLWRALLACAESDWSNTALGELRAHVDFRDRSTSKNPRDARLLDWWADFVGDAERGGIVLPRQAPKLDNMRAWLRRQVAPALALVVDADTSPEEMIRALLDQGRARYRAKPERVALLEAEWIRRGGVNAAD